MGKCVAKFLGTPVGLRPPSVPKNFKTNTRATTNKKELTKLKKRGRRKKQ